MSGLRFAGRHATAPPLFQGGAGGVIPTSSDSLLVPSTSTNSHFRILRFGGANQIRLRVTCHDKTAALRSVPIKDNEETAVREMVGLRFAGPTLRLLGQEGLDKCLCQHRCERLASAAMESRMVCQADAGGPLPRMRIRCSSTIQSRPMSVSEASRAVARAVNRRIDETA